jgi:hypothetical protein
MTAATLTGFVIANNGWSDQISLEMGCRSFGTTAGEAWRRHIGSERSRIDFPIIVQRWSDRGYGPRRVTIQMQPRSTDEVR